MDQVDSDGSDLLAVHIAGSLRVHCDYEFSSSMLWCFDRDGGDQDHFSMRIFRVCRCFHAVADEAVSKLALPLVL